MKPLNPIMAVLAIASLGVFPLRALAVDGSVTTGVPVTVPAGVPIAVEDTNSITRLTEILDKNLAAKADAGQRVADFLLLPDAEKKSFVASDVGAELRVVALDWAEKQTPGNLAMLYFVVGVGPKAPDWVMNDDLLKKTVFPKREAGDRLRKKLSRFTEAAGAQIKKAKEKDDAVAFLDLATIEAKKIFDYPCTKEQCDASVNRNDNTGVKVPDATGTKPVTLPGASQQYTLDDLYEKGAAVMNIAGPKDAHSRRISVKIYSTRAKNGDIVNEIGIFDITDKNDIFGQRFPMSGPNQSFILDDRTPGHKRYELKFGPQDENGDRPLTFGRPGADPKDPKAVITTSVSKLLLKRADQAEAMSNIVNVGGQDFYILPQGGARSVLMMFSKQAIDSRNLGQARYLKPALYSEVGIRGPEGGNINVDPGVNGGPELGEVGGKPYKLVYNKAIGAWEVTAGQGNKPERLKAEDTSGGGSGGGGGATKSDDGTMSASGKLLVEIMIKLMDKYRECKPGDTAGLKEEEQKDAYGLLTCNKTNKPEDQYVFVVVPSAHPNKQLRYARSATNDGKPVMNLLNGRMIDHYLVLQFDRMVQYLDLRKPTGVNTEAAGFEMAGFVMDGKTGENAETGFKDMLIFMDALRNYMGVTGQDKKAFDEVPASMEKRFGSKFTYIQASYRQDGNVKQLVVNGAANGKSFEVWPKDEVDGGDSGPASSQYEKLSGPTNAMDRIVSSVDEPLRAKFDIDKSMQAVAIHSNKADISKADIAIYKTVNPTTLADLNKHLVMFRYDALDLKAPPNPDGAKEKRTFRQKHFEVFNASNPLPLKGLQFQGLVGQTVITNRGAAGYRFVPGANAERGVLAVFEEKQVIGENVKDKPANCVGPIIWWGFNDRDAALKVCKDDKY